MATAPFTVVGKVVAQLEATLASTKVYLRNMYGEELEVQYDDSFDTTGMFTVNAGNFMHNPIPGDYLTIYAIDEVEIGGSGYRKTMNFVVTTTPQFVPDVILEYYDLIGPTGSMYFLEGAYTNRRENHLIMDVENAHSMTFYGDIEYPSAGERVLFNPQIVVRLTPSEGNKNVRVVFFSDNNNFTERTVAIIYDTIKPYVFNVTAPDMYNVHVVFSEMVRKEDAENRNYYAIAGLDIVSATLLEDYQTVVLNTNRMFSLRYTMEVSSVRDLAGNVMDSAIISFMGYEMAGFVWTPGVEAENVIQAVHLQELRTNAESRGVVPPNTNREWTDETLVVGETDIKWEHWSELREAIDKTFMEIYGRPVGWTTGQLNKDRTYLSARHLKELRAVVDAL